MAQIGRTRRDRLQVSVTGRDMLAVAVLPKWTPGWLGGTPPSLSPAPALRGDRARRRRRLVRLPRISGADRHADRQGLLLASRHDVAARQRPGRTGIPGPGAPCDLEPGWQSPGERRMGGLDGDEIVAGHLPRAPQGAQYRNDSRVALFLETDKRNPMGLNDTSSSPALPASPREVQPKLSSGSPYYLGPDIRFPAMDSPPAGYIAHIWVIRVSGVGPRPRSVDSSAYTGQ